MKKSSKLSEECIDFLCSMLEYDEKKRASIEQLQSHDWLKDANEHHVTMSDEFSQKAKKMSDENSS